MCLMAKGQLPPNRLGCALAWHSSQGEHSTLLRQNRAGDVGEGAQSREDFSLSLVRLDDAFYLYASAATRHLDLFTGVGVQMIQRQPRLQLDVIQFCRAERHRNHD